MYVVTEEGGDYDWSSHTNIFVVPTEELAKMLVELLEKEKASAKKFMKKYPDIWKMSAEKKIVFNKEVRDHFKYYPVEQHEMFETGTMVYSFIMSDWYSYYGFGYEKVEFRDVL